MTIQVADVLYQGICADCRAAAHTAAGSSRDL
jgi:hypothetical protein